MGARRANGGLPYPQPGQKRGEKLTKGLPQKNAYLNVLREGMAVDSLRSPGLYVGTNTGQLFFSADEGDSWRRTAPLFPSINSVGAATL